MPSGVTEVEKKAVEDATFQAGARDVKIIEEPIAAAIGAVSLFFRSRLSRRASCEIIADVVRIFLGF